MPAPEEARHFCLRGPALLEIQSFFFWLGLPQAKRKGQCSVGAFSDFKRIFLRQQTQNGLYGFLNDIQIYPGRHFCMLELNDEMQLLLILSSSESREKEAYTLTHCSYYISWSCISIFCTPMYLVMCRCARVHADLIKLGQYNSHLPMKRQHALILKL